MSNNGVSISNHGSLNGFAGNGTATIMTTAQARDGLVKHSSSPVHHQVSQTNQIRVQQQGQQQNPQKIFIQVPYVIPKGNS
jgi:hypothetical protein